MPKRPAPQSPETFKESVPALDEADVGPCAEVAVARVLAAAAVVVGSEEETFELEPVVTGTALTCVELK